MNPMPSFVSPGTPSFGVGDFQSRDKRPTFGQLMTDGLGRPIGRVGMPAFGPTFAAANDAAKANGLGERRVGLGMGMGMGLGPMPEEVDADTSATTAPSHIYGTGAARNPRGQGADPFDPRAQFDPRTQKYFAEGGEVQGPGGPKDDMVPAMLSDGEFVMPAEAVKFFGLDKLNKMKMKASEEMMGMNGGIKNGGSAKGGMGAPQTIPDFPFPIPHSPMPVPAFAEGGPVIANPYADDPAAYAARQRQANDMRLASMGITDTGMGSRVLANKYGTGFAVQAPAGAPGVFNNDGMQATATPGKGLMMVPDVVQSGPWAMPGMMDDPAARRAEIAAKSAQLMQNAPFARGIDQMTDTLKARFTDKGRANITIPTNPGLPQGPAVGNPFWEREAAAAANLAPDPSMLVRPDGVQQKDWRRFVRSPQGIQAGLGAAEDAKRAAADAKRAAGAKDFTPVPGSPDYLINSLGNVVPKGSTKPVAMTMEEATKMGLEIASVDEQGRAKWKPKAATTKPGKVKYWDTEGRKVVELDEDDEPPADSGLVPMKRKEDPASAPAAQTSATVKPSSRFLSAVK